MLNCLKGLCWKESLNWRLKMWNAETRARYDRKGLRYPSDLTDAEWEIVAPLIPPAKRGGRQREVDLRAVVNGLLYVLENGCKWRSLPKDFPPRSTVHGYVHLWAWDGTLERIHHELYVRTREHEGREASPTAAILDSQSVRSAEKGGPSRTRWAMMPARRSKGSSTISSSIPSDCC